LFTYQDTVYALGRHNPQKPRPLRWIGSILGKKRTALYRVDEKELTYLSDLPSCGDTSYVGAVVKGGDLYASYYTNDINKDYPWIMGMVSPSDIRIVKFPLSSLPGLGR
jgi:hypothetical protein